MISYAQEKSEPIAHPPTSDLNILQHVHNYFGMSHRIYFRIYNVWCCFGFITFYMYFVWDPCKNMSGKVYFATILTRFYGLPHFWIPSHVMGFLSDTQNVRLRMRRGCRERFHGKRLQRKPLVSDPGMHHGTWVMHVIHAGIANPRWRGKSPRHSEHWREI